MKSLAVAALLALSAASVSPALATVTISAAKTKHMTCEDGACVPTSRVANLNTADLAAMLAQGDAKVFTGNGAISIQITAPLSWTSASTLTLTADHSVSIRAGITVAGPGGLTIVDNRLNDGGLLVFSPGGSVSFWDTASSLSINTLSFTLVADLPTLASDIAANPSGAYALAKSYNAFTDGIYLHSPIPTSFTGTFEGLGNTIDQISIRNGSDSDTEIGMFSEIATGGLVEDVNLTNFTINVFGTGAGGGIAGGAMGGTIFNTSTSGTITGTFYAGGIAGQSFGGTIVASRSSVNVSGGYAGGIVGYDTGTVTGAHASGNVTGAQTAGGLAGQEDGTVSLSSASGNVTGAAEGFAGGFIGGGAGQVSFCFSTGNVAIDQTPKGRAPGRPRGFFLGGFIGYAHGFISDSYATGAVTGVAGKGSKPSSAGGFAGVNQVTIQNSYSIGKVSLDRGYAGGFVGSEQDLNGGSGLSGTIWDLDTSGISDPSRGAGNLVKAKGVKGLTTAKLTSHLPQQFEPSEWAQSPGINNGFPYLIANPPQ